MHVSLAAQIQISPTPTALSLLSYHLLSLPTYCSVPSNRTIRPYDRFLPLVSHSSFVSSPCGKFHGPARVVSCDQHSRTGTDDIQQWNFRVHQLLGGEGQEVHSQHTRQWQVAPRLHLQCPLAVTGYPKPNRQLLTSRRSCTSRVPWLRLRRSGN